jgi:hypothetical protein
MLKSISHRRSSLACAMVAAAGFLAWWASFARGQPVAERPVEWRTADAVRNQLQARISVDWEDVRLAQAVATLSRSQRVAIVLDRRVDPSREFRLALKDQPLDAVLKGLALKHKLGVARLGPVIYLGPRETAERLHTILELRKQDLGRLPPALRTALLRAKPVRWEMLAEPRELLRSLARQYQTPISGIDTVPHDLWDERELPAMSFVEQLTLIAGQFDLTFEFDADGRSVRLVPMSKRPVLEKTYANPPGAAAKLKGLLKHSELEVVANRLLVRGPAEEHEIVEELLSGRRVSRTTVTEGKRYFPQVNAVGPVGKLIRDFAKRLELDFEIDEQAIRDAGISLDHEVHVTLKDADEQDLWRAVLAPAGLEFERVGKKLIVRPAKRPTNK